MAIKTTFNTKVHAYSVRIKGLGGIAITTYPKRFRGVVRSTHIVDIHGFGVQVLLGSSKAWKWR